MAIAPWAHCPALLLSPCPGLLFATQGPCVLDQLCPLASLGALHCPWPSPPAGCQHPKPHSPLDLPPLTLGCSAQTCSPFGAPKGPLLSPQPGPLPCQPQLTLACHNLLSQALTGAWKTGDTGPMNCSPSGPLRDALAPSASETFPPMVLSPPGLAVRLAPPIRPKFL